MSDHEKVLASIGDFADRHELTAEQLERTFFAGVVAVQALRPEWPVSQKANGPGPGPISAEFDDAAPVEHGKAA